MPRLDEIRDDLIAALDAHYGSMPAADGLHIDPDSGSNLFRHLVHVALSLVAAPQVAAKAFEALDGADLLDPAALASAHPLEIDNLLKEARVAMAIKSFRPLQGLARWVTTQRQPFETPSLAGLATASIREEWRAINGIGLASADALLLLGLGRVSYPVDRATYRVLVRHGWLDATAEYDEARELVERLARSDRTRPNTTSDDLGEVAAGKLLGQLSGWFGRLGHDFCNPTQARCERCPLRGWLPPAGPIEVE